MLPATIGGTGGVGREVEVGVTEGRSVTCRNGIRRSWKVRVGLDVAKNCFW